MGMSCSVSLPIFIADASFITSTNNHISRITSLMHKLTQKYSAPLLTYDNRTYHLFPSPLAIPSELESELRLMGFGYRASFLESSLATLRQEFGSGPGEIESGLLGWRKGEMIEVRDKLLGLKGVGRKVADCVMLMCLDRVRSRSIDEADNSYLSYLSTHTSPRLQLGTHPFLADYATSQCRSRCMKRRRSSWKTSGVR
jgi:hypothetical protein